MDTSETESTNLSSSTDSTGSTDWLDIASSCSSFCDEIYEFSWLRFDVDVEFKPVLHQKRIYKQQYNIPKPRKGVGFAKQFKGIKYSIGKKK